MANIFNAEVTTHIHQMLHDYNEDIRMGRIKDKIEEQHYNELETLLQVIANADSGSLKTALLVSLEDLKRQESLSELLDSVSPWEEEEEEPDIYHFDEDEFFDVTQVLVHGYQKGYPRDNWLEPDGKGISHKENHASICRHVAEGYCGITADHDSGLHPYLHAATRLLMEYTRWKRGILHPLDESKGTK